MCAGGDRQSTISHHLPGKSAMIATKSEGYSASIDIRLRVSGGEYRVAQVGESFLIMRDKITVPLETDAEVIITVDGEQFVHPVFLHEGIGAESDLVKFL